MGNVPELTLEPLPLPRKLQEFLRQLWKPSKFQILFIWSGLVQTLLSKKFQTYQNMYEIVQTSMKYSNWFLIGSKLVLTCPYWSRFFSNLSKPVQTYPNLFKLVQTCLKLFKMVQACPKLVKIGLILSKLYQTWSRISASSALEKLPKTWLTL